MTRHRFGFQIRLDRYKGAIVQTRFEKESGDKSPHSKA
jgi:hypothetical protein